MTLGSQPTRRGFTLVELLVVIMIIGILAALVLGVASVAGETAREQKTKHVVERLHTLLTDFYGTFKTRRIGLRETQGSNEGIASQIATHFAGSASNAARIGQATAAARLYATRELLLTEIPDRWSDVVLNDIGSGSSAPSSSAGIPFYLKGRTELSTTYLRRYLSLLGRINTLSGQPNTADEVKTNQGAECLYMVITLATADGEARTLFGESTIGDTDGDGAPEFLDGWGHPISFLRWAPGFDSQIQANANVLDAGGATAWKLAASGDHDPTDLFRVDANAFRLVPLIYSGGRDESLGIEESANQVTWGGYNSPNIAFMNAEPYIGKPILSPYTKVPTEFSDSYLGTSLHEIGPAKYDETATDNIHNHLLGKR